MLRCPHTVSQTPSTFLKTLVNTYTSSFGVPLYEKAADATTALYAIVLSSLKSSILMSMRSPETPVMSSLSIIAFIISCEAGLPDGRQVQPFHRSKYEASSGRYVWMRSSRSRTCCSSEDATAEKARGMAGREEARDLSRADARPDSRPKKAGRSEAACITLWCPTI